MRHDFQRVLQEDIRQGLKVAGSIIEVLMEDGRFKEAWDHLVRWYRHARGEKAHPDREGVNRESKVRAELYRCRPPARLKVPILVQSTEVSNELPTEAKVNMEVRGIRTGRSGGPSGMRVEDFKGWCKEAKREKDPVGRRQELLVWQVIFRDETVPV